MLFNSYTYLLFFLPLALLGFGIASRRSLRAGFGWLVLCSLIYYGCWNPDPSQPWRPWYVLVIIGSCLGNFLIGRRLARGSRGSRGAAGGKPWLVGGIAANLLLLVYFKYTGFIAGMFHDLLGRPAVIPDVVLALGVSFFTFQQIAYLVDAWRGEAEECHLVDYFLFVCFWPQLIAGPIVHHSEMLPQFRARSWRRRRWVNQSCGLTILVIGLFKKVVIADNVAPIADGLFDLAGSGLRPLTMLEAWAGAIAYAVQIYFDFSAYTDMAIGSARLFGIRLPLNFHSPYKAASVVEFWRRWHITLSRFLRDYLYVPLGGSRRGGGRRLFNLLVTMALGGLWHGAGWTYLLWGLLHGLFLCVNHAWRVLCSALRLPAMPRPLAVALTFLAVLIAWVPFRAGVFELGSSGSTTRALAATGSMFESMFGAHGFGGWPDSSAYVVKDSHALRACLVMLLAWFLPNTQQFMSRYQPAIDPSGLVAFSRGPRRWWHWRPTTAWFMFVLVLLLAAIHQFDKLSRFIYFQF